MITDKILLENGYKEWPKESCMNEHCNRFFQKRFKNEKGQTKYFITIYEYVFKVFDYVPTYDVQLHFEKDKYNMNIQLFGIDENMTLEEIEREVYAIWYGLDCKYYDEGE